jgi:RND family efflux transporter MFP subunit
MKPLQSRSRKILYRVVGGVVIFAVVVAGSAILRQRTATHDSVQAAAFGSPTPSPATVGVFRVGRRDLTRTQTITAELHPYLVTDLYAKVSGYLRTISVDYGSIVHSGETLAVLELPEQQADLERTQAALHLATLEYDRVRSVQMEHPGLIAQQDVDKAEADYETAKDDNARASTIMGYTNITAPYDGVVTKRYVNPGALIEMGVSSSNVIPIVQVADNYRLRLVIETPETTVPDIRVGTPVTVHVQGEAGSFPATVSRYSYDVHEDTRTMHTEVDIANPTLRLKPGMYADATIALETLHDVVAVPTQAVSTTSGKDNVWIVDRNDILRERDVTVGLQTPNWDQVSEGLEPGERVFIGDRSSLSPGARVVPKFIPVPKG